MSQCFSGLAWVWESFLRLSRVGGPELDVHGGTAQSTIMGLPGVKSLQGQVRRGTEEGFGHSAKFSPSSCQQDYSIWLWQGMGEGNSAGRACEELTLPASRAQPHEVGGSSALGGPGNGCKVGLLAAGNTEVGAARERWETTHCNCCRIANHRAAEEHSASRGDVVGKDV